MSGLLKLMGIDTEISVGFGVRMTLQQLPDAVIAMLDLESDSEEDNCLTIQDFLQENQSDAVACFEGYSNERKKRTLSDVIFIHQPLILDCFKGAPTEQYVQSVRWKDNQAQGEQLAKFVLSVCPKLKRADVHMVLSRNMN